MEWISLHVFKHTLCIHTKYTFITCTSLHYFSIRYMFITCICIIFTFWWHVLHDNYMSCQVVNCFTMAWNLMLDLVFVLHSLIDVQEKIRSRPSTWMVVTQAVAFLPVSGPESTWDNRGGNSKVVRSTELMMECNHCSGCLSKGRNEQTTKSHMERWAGKSAVQTHIVRIGHTQDKQEGDKMLGDPARLGSVTTAIVQHHTF